MKDNRERLKEVIDSLTEIYEDDSADIGSVAYSIYSSACTKHGNKEYGDTLFENIVIVWEP